MVTLLDPPLHEFLPDRFELHERSGKAPKVEIMIPLVAQERELELARDRVLEIAEEEGFAYGSDFGVGTMIELPRACFVADRIARLALMKPASASLSGRPRASDVRAAPASSSASVANTVAIQPRSDSFTGSVWTTSAARLSGPDRSRRCRPGGDRLPTSHACRRRRDSLKYRGFAAGATV